MQQPPQPVEPTKRTSRLGWTSLIGMGVSTLLTVFFGVAWFIYTIKFQPRGPGIPQSDDEIAPILAVLVFCGVVLQHICGGLGIVALFQRNTSKVAPGCAAGCGFLFLLFWVGLVLLGIVGASV